MSLVTLELLVNTIGVKLVLRVNEYIQQLYNVHPLKTGDILFRYADNRCGNDSNDLAFHPRFAMKAVVQSTVS